MRMSLFTFSLMIGTKACFALEHFYGERRLLSSSSSLACFGQPRSKDNQTITFIVECPGELVNEDLSFKQSGASSLAS